MTYQRRTPAAVLACALALHAFALVGAQGDLLTPEQFASEASGPTFQLAPNGLDAASMMDLVYECLRAGAQTDGTNLIVYGFSQVDARLYRLQGPRALETGLRGAELRARGQAVEFFNAVLVDVRGSDTETDTATQQGVVTTTGSGDSFSAQLSSQLVSTLTRTTTSYVSGTLRGGRTTGTKLISLGDQGMCVGVRYEVPLDQRAFDPVERAREEADAAPPATRPGSTQQEQPGFAPLPPGRVGDF